MEPLTIGYSGAGLLFVFLAFGIPVGVAMGIIGIGGMLLGAGPLPSSGLTGGKTRHLTAPPELPETEDHHQHQGPPPRSHGHHGDGGAGGGGGGGGGRMTREEFVRMAQQKRKR